MGDSWSSHVDATENDEFLVWLNEKCGEHGEVKAERSQKFDYLGVNYDLSKPGVLKIDMIDCMKNMLEEFPMHFGDSSEEHAAPADLFSEGTGKKIDAKRRETFHKFIAKGLFACKRARPDIHHVREVTSRLILRNGVEWGLKGGGTC